MIQIISSLLKDKADKTKINLIFANVTPEDIILKNELDSYAKAHPDRFKVTYVIDKAVDGWKGPTGYVNAELIKKYIPDVATGNTKVFICGPPRKSYSLCSVFFVCHAMLFACSRSIINHGIACPMMIVMMKSVCGAKGPNFTQGEVDGALKELGLDSEHVFKF